MAEQVLRQDGKAITGQIFGQLLRLALGYLTLAITTHALGKRLYGDYAFALAVIATLSPLGSPGTRQVSIRMLDRGVSAKDALGQPIKAELYMTLMVLVGGVAICWSVGGAMLGTLGLILGLGNLGSFGQILETQLLQKGDYSSVIHSQNTQSILNLLCCCIAWVAGLGVNGFAISYTLSQIVRTTRLVGSTVKDINYWKCSFDFSTFIRIVKSGYPYLLGGIGVSLLSRIDAFMVMGIQGASETGLLSVASRICESTYLVIIVTERTLVSSIIGQSGGDRSRAVRKLFIGMTLAGVVACISMIAISQTTGYIFGEEFSQSGAILQVLSFSGIAISFNCAVGSWMEMHGARRWIAARSILALVANVAINALLIKPFGAFGAGVGTTCSLFISALLPLLLDTKLRSQIVESCR